MTEIIIRKAEVTKLTGLPHSTIYRLIREGKFPAPIKITGKRASGWLIAEIQAYVAKCVQESRSNLPHNNQGICRDK